MITCPLSPVPDITSWAGKISEQSEKKNKEEEDTQVSISLCSSPSSWSREEQLCREERQPAYLLRRLLKLLWQSREGPAWRPFSLQLHQNSSIFISAGSKRNISWAAMLGSERLFWAVPADFNQSKLSLTSVNLQVINNVTSIKTPGKNIKCPSGCVRVWSQFLDITLYQGCPNCSTKGSSGCRS